MWRSALQEENEGGEKEKVDDDAMIRTALREVLEAKFNIKTTMPREKRQKKIFDDGEQKQREEQNNGFASWSSLCENRRKRAKVKARRVTRRNVAVEMARTACAREEETRENVEEWRRVRGYRTCRIVAAEGPVRVRAKSRKGWRRKNTRHSFGRF